MITLAPATAEDDAAILAIFNDVIATTIAIYREEPTTLEERREWREARQAKGFPVIVARDGDIVAGIGSFAEFRTNSGFRYTVEHSVHVHSAFRGKGVGRKLIGDLLARAAADGKHVMVASIDGDNLASLALHESLGFTRCAHIREVGHKFGAWRDVVFMQHIFS